ncbi:MAG TPA: hypothetical protein VFZ12_01220 [Dehalococcoidia bacterium]|nr:hypothetical protein [Dehalococcoidia bacterium]
MAHGPTDRNLETGEPLDETGSPVVTPYLVAARILAVLGMSFAIAVGIFLMLAGGLLIGFAILLAALPFFLLMRYVENRTPRPEPGEGEELDAADS